LPLAANSKPHTDADALALLTPGSSSAISQPLNWGANAMPRPSKKKRVAQGVTQIEINAPRNVVWSVLTDFQQRHLKAFNRAR